MNMNKDDLTGFAEYLLKIAVCKTGNIHDAEDLVQDTLLAALAFIDSGKTPENPKAWLSSVLDRKFYDSIRRKYRKPTISMDTVSELAEEERLFECIEKGEEAENIRRCVGLLTKKYREVIVRHYMNGESVKEIAKALGIPENTVKSRLYAGRSHIGKEFKMENYTKQSYQPETLWVGHTGQAGLNDEPFSLVGTDRIKMNLLILAYEKPLTVPELAKAIGIPAAYVEPIVEELVKSELMGRSGDKVYTDFIIYTEKDRIDTLNAQLKAAEENYREIWELADTGLKELREQDFYKVQRPSARRKLESHFVINTLKKSVVFVRDEVCGGVKPFSEYRQRPDGGKWYAMGNRYPDNYDDSSSPHKPYHINGEWGAAVYDFLDTKVLYLRDYDTELCHAHKLYDMRGIGMDGGKEFALKMLYAVYNNNRDAFSAVDKRCIDSIDRFIEMGYLSKDTSGKLVCEVPVIEEKERQRYCALSEKYAALISEEFHDVFMSLMKKPMEIPPHVKSYLNWERYDLYCHYLPMAVVLKAKEEGIYDNNEAAVYMSWQYPYDYYKK